MRYRVNVPVVFFLWMVISLMGYSQNPDVSSPEYNEGKTYGELAEATLEYWENYFQENYFSRGYTWQDMKGTGYKQFLRFKWFYEWHKDAEGNFPSMKRWEMYEQSRQNVMQTSDIVAAANWVSIGPNTIDTLAGRMLSYAFDPVDNQIIWAGSGSGGLWKTTNGGDRWEPVTDDLPSMPVSSVAVNPFDRDMILIGTGAGMSSSITLYPGVGVLKSTNGGLTWDQTDYAYQSSQGVSTYRLTWDPQNANNVYLSATNGIWVSRDAGDTWEAKILTAGINHGTDMVINKQSPNILYAAIRGDGIYKSTDSGENWQRLSSGLPASASMHYTSLAICDSFPNVLYAGITDPVNWSMEGLYKTTNGGDTWTQLSNVPDVYCQPASTSCIGWFVNLTAVSPVDPDLIFIGGVQMWRSDNGGQSWTWHDYLSNPLGQSNAGLVYVDQHNFAFDPVDPTVMYVFNDGGVQKSTDNGLWWERKANGLVTGQIYRLASAPSDANILTGGFQDHGLQGADLSNGNRLWNRWSLGDGAAVNIHPTNPNILYGDNFFGSHFKSIDGGSSPLTTFPINNGIPSNESAPLLVFTIMHPIDPDILYTHTSQKIYKTTNGGSSWESVGVIANVRSLAIDRVNPDIVYAHSYTGTNWSVWRSMNGGGNWTEITHPSIPSWRVTDLEADPNQEGVIYATRNSALSNNDHVKKSTDYGDTWVDITHNLPDIFTNAIAINPYNSDHLYLATDLGVYVSLNGGTQWQEFNDNLPLVYSYDIHIHPVDSTVRIATIGRGAWKTKMVDPQVTGIGDVGNFAAPVNFQLYRNYPNPFNPVTTIPYQLSVGTDISIKIYNELGQEVIELFSGRQSEGEHSIIWDGKNANGLPAASGIYFVRLKADGFAKSVKLTLIR